MCVTTHMFMFVLFYSLSFNFMYPFSLFPIFYPCHLLNRSLVAFATWGEFVSAVLRQFSILLFLLFINQLLQFAFKHFTAG